MRIRELLELMQDCHMDSEVMWLNEDGVMEPIENICVSNGTLYIGVDEEDLEEAEEQEDLEAESA